MNKKSLMIALAALAAAPQAFAYTVDGSLSADWGLQSNWTVNSAVKLAAVEDQTGSGAFFLDPGWGGQAYDAEALYLDWDSSRLYVAIVTGLSPTTVHNPAANSYGAGDILIDFGGGGFDFGLVLTNIAGLSKGGLYSVSSLNYGLWSASGVTGPAPNPYPVAVKTGSNVASTQLVYSTTSFTGMGSKPTDKHYVIEASIPVSAFGAAWGPNGPAQDMTVWWGAYCANDIISDGIGASNQVPEPGSLVLAVLGLAGLAGLRRRRS